MVRFAALWIASAGLIWAQSVPGPGLSWKKSPGLGFDRQKLQEALAFATKSGSDWDFARDQERVFGRPLGPVPQKRAATNMVIVRDGVIVAEFGDTQAVDPVYSAAKSFLSMMAGLAFDQGRIKDVNAPVGATIHDGGYDSPHNAKVTWQHHLHQTSEWQGELWGKKSDFLGKAEFGSGERQPREIQAPGSYYEYNDVRVNRFSLSLLKLFSRPLPSLLKEHIMDPIGASDTWKWHGYANSNVAIEGEQMASVPGGTRWGGGIWMHSRDLARVGLLALGKGRWKGKQLLSERWFEMSLQPSRQGPDYGYLWWLNTKGKQWPSAPRTSFAAVGNGSNIIWVDPEHRLVVVWRWFDNRALDTFLGKLLQALAA